MAKKNEKEKENIHEDHRKRMRQKYKLSRDAMPDHEILELLLFFSIPRKNTNPIAHALLNRFGSLDGVFKASAQALKEIPGVGDSTVLLLDQVSYLGKRMALAKMEETSFASYEKISKYLVTVFSSETVESVYVFLIDARANLITYKKMFEGTVTCTSVDARRIAEYAIANNAARVIIAHNHPGGTATPSADDLATTRYLKRVLRGIDIELVEHFMVAGSTICPILDYISQSQRIEF